jgi:hypothetical protein
VAGRASALHAARSRVSGVAAPSRVDRGLVVALLVALAFLALLAASVGVDPARGVTASTSPYTDEGWNVVNARNFVLFGHWSTDDWNMYLVNLPFSLLEAAWLAVTGVGIVQARLLVIVAGALGLAVLGGGLRRPLGVPGAALAAAALGGSALLLYYGRLAYLEPLVMLWLIVALVVLGGQRPSLGTGMVAGLALALAIATKASAGFAAGGMLAGLAVVEWRDAGVRRAVMGAVVALLLAALAWAVVCALPQPAALATDLRIWAPEPLPHSLAELLRRIAAYPTRSDGAIPLALPLLVAGAAGLVVVILRRAALTPSQRRIGAACVGWFAVGMGVLLVVPYRPNRYLVPLLPPLAVLAGLGFALLVTWLGMRRCGPVAAAACVLAVVLAAPGLALQVGWVSATPSTLPGAQARIMAIVPPGAAIQGDLAPLLAMRARAVTIVSRPASQVNGGDLYATRGVRWVFTAGPAPAWAPLHRAAWDARTSVLCVSWGPGRTCLYRLP